MIWLAALLVQGWTRDRLRGMGWQAASLGILFGSILFHELAHCWMAIRRGLGADEILLWPLGGLSYTGQSSSEKDEIKVAGVGPLSNFALGGACLGALLLTGAPWNWDYLNPFESWWIQSSITQTLLVHAVRINLILGLFNLCIPAYPLDGGRMLFAWLTIRHGRAQAALVTGRIALVVGVAMSIWGIAQHEFTLVLIGVWVLVEAFQVMRLARSGDLEAHPAFSATPPEYSARDDGGGEPGRPGFFARWRARRAQRRAAREAEEAREMALRVDDILAKVSREGIGSLSSDERRILEEASRRGRGEE